MSSHTDTEFAPEGRVLAKRANRRARVATSAIWLVGLAALGLGAYTLFPFFLSADTPVAVVVKPDHPKQAVAYDGAITGLDKNQKPFSIKASKGLQDDKAKDVVHLDNIAGQFAGSSGQPLDVASQQGEYNSKSRVLVLDGNVVIRDGKGMTARMDKALFNTETKALESKTPVQVDLANGTIAADTLTADNDGERLLFKGRVKATIGTSR
jgi:lipopolysaccharide export system protein LptC